MRLAAKISAAFAFLLARIITGVYVHHLLLEKPFHRLLDLDLVGARANSKDILVVLLT